MSPGQRSCRRFFPRWRSNPTCRRSLLLRSHGSGGGNGPRVRSKAKGCNSLFWIQQSALPHKAIQAASYLNFRARRSNYVLDAWKRFADEDRACRDGQRLDPCFVAYREATDELRRRFPLAKFVWLPFGAHTDTFHPHKRAEVDLRLLDGPSHEPLHRRCWPIAKRAICVTSISKDGGLQHRGTLTADLRAPNISSPLRLIWITPGAPADSVR